MNSEDPVALVATFEDDFDEYTTTKNAVGKNATSTIVSQRAIPTVTVDAIFQYLVTTVANMVVECEKMNHPNISTVTWKKAVTQIGETLQNDYLEKFSPEVLSGFFCELAKLEDALDAELNGKQAQNEIKWNHSMSISELKLPQRAMEDERVVNLVSAVRVLEGRLSALPPRGVSTLGDVLAAEGVGGTDDTHTADDTHTLVSSLLSKEDKIREYLAKENTHHENM